MGKTLTRAMLAVSMLTLAVPAMAQDGRWGRGGNPAGGDSAGRDSAGRGRGWQGTQAPVGGTGTTTAPAERQGRWQGRGEGGFRGDFGNGNGGGNGQRGWRGRDGATTQPVPLPTPQTRPAWQGRQDRTPGADSNRQGRDWNESRNWNQGRDWNRGSNWNQGRDWNQGSRWQNDRRGNDGRWSDQRRWDRDWRRDSRYDWSDYRRYNRDVYRLPRYRAPYGWSYGYRSFGIGVLLDSVLFSDSYWIDDPWTYRLPPAYGTLRWVRYYDDALLVDVRDGYVVDVIRNFFW